MAQVKEKLWTLEEFLAFDDGTDTSYQLFEGRIVAMNPPLRGHGSARGPAGQNHRQPVEAPL